MHKTTSRDGTTIAFETTGDGPPVIIVEGAMCDRRTSAPLAALLAEDFTVFSYDRRGKGDSGDTRPWAVRREIEDLEAIIAAAGGAARVYGMSSGAILALDATASGLGVTSLAMFEPPLDVSGDGTETAEFIARLIELVSAGRRGDAVEHFLVSGPQLSADVIARMRQQPFWAGLEAVAHTLVYDNTIAADSTVLARAASVAVPALVMNGTESPDFLRDAARAVAAAVPGAEHRELDGQTHAVEVAVLAPVLAEFFPR